MRRPRRSSLFAAALTLCAAPVAAQIESGVADVLVRVSAGVHLPEEVLEHVSPGQRPSARRPLERQITLQAADKDAIERAAVTPGVKSIEIARPPVSGTLPTVGALNANARQAHRIDEFLGTFGQFTGRDVRIGLFELGAVRASHLEFRRDLASKHSSRVTVRTKAQTSNHATHVCGTICASGRQRPEALGMAPDARVVNEDATADITKLSEIAATIRISNHSYGFVCGWDQDEAGTWSWRGNKALTSAEDARFGKYAPSEELVDTILSRNPHLLMVVAAGNDRDDAPNEQPVAHFDYEYVDGLPREVPATDEHPPDAQHGGFDTLSGLAVAKNTLVVGAMANTPPGSEMAAETFSSWGPTDDGRLKPDLVAAGYSLLSPSAGMDDSYVPMSGTSQAAPVVAGLSALLVEQYHAARRAYPLAIEIKAALIHSANQDVGAPGPDLMSGWGSVNALLAGAVISGASGRTLGRVQVDSGGLLEQRFVSGGAAVRVTAVWSDPPGEPHDLYTVNDRRSVLVNDIDLLLVDPQGNEHHPWSISSDGHAVRTRPNHADNVEVIDAPGAAGEWTLRLRAGSLRDGKPQTVALVVEAGE